MRGAPQSGFASDIVRISVRTVSGTVGHPVRWRLFQVQNKAEGTAVPRDDRRGLDDDERRSPSGPQAGQPDPQPSVRGRERQLPRHGSLQHQQLVSQREDIELKGGDRTVQWRLWSSR